MDRLRRSGGTCACSLATVVPPMVIRPAVTRSIPARQRSSVVLPDPDGPSSTTNVPGSTCRLTSLRARLPPVNSLLTFSTAMLSAALPSATGRRPDPAPARGREQPVAAEHEADCGQRDSHREH